MEPIKLKNKIIGTDQPCFIIAEAGVNHNGQLDLAKQLVDAAVSASADAVKFQTFIAEGVVTTEAGIADYAKNNVGKNIKQIDMLKNCQLSYDDFVTVKEYCDKKGIIFLSTPHSFDAIDFLENLVSAYKIGSGDLTNLPALQYIAQKKKPMILGTGMGTLDEIRSAVSTIRSEGNNDIVVLHCTTNYPCPFEDVNLRAMLTMQLELDCFVGYSDHTEGLLVPPLAAAFGAVVLEKHFTLDKKLIGPDHKASLDPAELKRMIKKIRDVEKILGNAEKVPTESEKTMMKLVRKSIVAKQDIKKGAILRNDMLAVKRPGTGISPIDMEKVIGRKTKRNIIKDELIDWDMVQ